MADSTSKKRASAAVDGDDGAASKRSRTAHVPTVREIVRDPLTAKASQYWAPGTEGEKRGEFDAEVVASVYRDDLGSGNFDVSRVMLLEFSCFLENYLWPNFDEATSSYEHVMCIVLMLNEKFRENVPAWDTIRSTDKFPAFFRRLMRLQSEHEMGTRESISYLVFLIHCFQSLEEPAVRQSVLQLVSLRLWRNLSPARREQQLREFPQLERHWQYMQARMELEDACYVERKRIEHAQTAGAATQAAANKARKLVQETEEWLEQHSAAGRSVTALVADIQGKQAEVKDGVAGLLAGKTSPGRRGGGGRASRRTSRGRTRSSSNADEAEAAEAAEAGAGEFDAAAVLAERLVTEAGFLPSLLARFFRVLDSLGEEADALEADERQARVLYVERFVEFLIDLLSQLPTRRFFRPSLQDQLFSVRCRQAALAARAEGRLFVQLLDILTFYLRFEINDHTGEALGEHERDDRVYARLALLQRVAFKQLPDKLRELALGSVGAITTRDGLLAHLSKLSEDELLALAKRLRVVTAAGEEAPSKELLLDAFVEEFQRRESQIDAMNSMPLMPNEEVLWDANQVPFGHYSGDTVLALPKLNLQFLTIHDYLLRSFQLFRLEACYEIREDLVDTVRRLAPRKETAPDGRTITSFAGWARMATPLTGLRVLAAKPARVGERVPAEVAAEARYSVDSFTGRLREEWDALREHDVVFLLTIRAPEQPPAPAQRSGRAGAAAAEEDETFPARYGVVYVRGAEVVHVRDEAGAVMNDFSGPPANRSGRPAGTARVARLLLDPAQYQLDMDRTAAQGEAVYETFNVLVRRKPKENNFKAILDTIRGLMNDAAVGRAVPPWLHDIFLGYGDPGAASYRRMPGQLRTVDFKDTFVSAAHLRASFPGAEVQFQDERGQAVAAEEADELRPPFRVAFHAAAAPAAERDAGANGGAAAAAAAAAAEGGRAGERVVAQAYRLPNPGPYPQDQPKFNQVPFTPVQVEAIRSGVNPGLTMVVGPPGTGKTDVAVQIIANLYHNFPSQRIVLVTHSNQALNDLFAKIMERDVDERHLLRLGMGEKGLATAKDFSKQGRVNYTLQRRIELLAEVERLARSLGVEPDVAYSCENAEHFFSREVAPRIDAFRSACDRARGAADAAAAVAAAFPFKDFFASAPTQPLFAQRGFAEDREVAEGCFRHLARVLEELRDCRAFELLRTGRQRADFLVAKQARIVAMTCTHAALIRRQLVEMDFKYDTLVMEEAAQVLEVETLIPMLLQKHDAVEGCRLKRVVLIGDHHQLPPVVKNMAFQKYGRLDQSLFARFVRLGTPAIELDAQGRARPSIAALYNWRYKALGDLPAVLDGEEYRRAVTGMRFDYQLVDVGNFEGRGETQPTPYFYQNLGEAEYVVATYQYLRLCGVPASSITILTTYNGQKHLLRDVINARCTPYPIFGAPHKVTTVDRYQGQQNDIVLLSLVRTRAVGHLRDVRRLVVAMSRARLGLYVFCRRALFENCYELTNTFSQFARRPDKLQLVAGETHPTTRRVDEEREAFGVQDVTHMGVIVHQLTQAALQREAAMAEAAAAAAAAAAPDHAAEGDEGDEEGPASMSMEEDMTA